MWKEDKTVQESLRPLLPRAASVWARRVPVFACFVIFASGGLAEDQQGQSDAGPNVFYFTSPLEVSEGYDSGLVAGRTRFSDYETLLTAPTFAWDPNTHRTEFVLDYEPEFEIFSRYGRLDAWNHFSTMRLTHHINSRWALIAGNSFLSTSDTGRSLGNSLVLLPRGRYLQDSVYGGLSYRVSQTTKLTFRADASVNTIQLPAPITGQLDNATSAISVALDRSLTPSQGITVTYSFLHYSPFHPNLSGGPENVNVVNGVYTYDFGRGFLLRLAGGVVEGPQAGITGSATVEKTFGRMWTAAGYQPYVGFFAGLNPANGPQSTELSFAGSVTPSDVCQVISFRARGQIWKRLGTEVAGARASNTDSGAAGNIRSLVGQLRPDYKLNDRLTIFAPADYYGQNMNRFIGEPVSSRRYFCGLDVNISRGPRSKEGNYSHRSAARANDDLAPDAPEPKDGTGGRNSNET
jgi:hypothetical protein